MVSRDPSTGQFVAGDEYDDVEVVTFNVGAGVQAADMAGTTSFGGEKHGFEGVKLVDYDSIVDRNESLVLLEAHHRLSVYSNSTQTADGVVGAGVEVSSSPSKSVSQVEPGGNTFSAPILADANVDDTIDLLGRPLAAFGQSAFSDTATGVGGGGSAGEDQVDLYEPPIEVGEFHPRDELFFNGEFRAWNIDDAGIHAQLDGQHIYGVVSE